MNISFANRMAGLKPSAIREFFKNLSDPNIISFAAGSPNPKAFPIEEVQRITAEILCEDPITALQYGATEGYPKLLTAVQDMVEKRQGFPVKREELIITSGAQQAIELCAKVLCNEGDEVICENPSFIGSLNSFRSLGAKLVGVDMQEDGMDLDQLEEALKTHPRVRFIYVIANFQNPTGITTSYEKRKAIYRLAQQYNKLILEDNPYGDLRFAGEPVPAIKTLDTDNRVMYCGTFSKILSPGLRVGFLIAHPEIIAKASVAKQGEDVHTPMLNQMIAEKFLTTFDFDSHIQSISHLYGELCQLMLKEMDQQFAPCVTHSVPQGGLFVWCTLPQGTDIGALLDKAVQKQVAAINGNTFSVTGKELPCLRLNYSMPTPENIVKGIRILGDLTKELL